MSFRLLHAMDNDLQNNTPTSETCLVTRHNKTLFTISTYEGIPETLILNLVAWVFLVLLFTVLRQQAWDYGRLVKQLKLQKKTN